MSAFDDVAAIAPQQIWDGIVGRVVHGEQLTIGVVELDPGTIVPEHSHENEQLGIVLRGSLVFRVGEETRELASGATYRIVANTPHAAEAGPDGAIVIDVFSPVRDDWRMLPRGRPRPPRWPD